MRIMKIDRELCKLRLNSGEYRCIFLHNYAHSGWNGYKLQVRMKLWWGGDTIITAIIGGATNG